MRFALFPLESERDDIAEDVYSAMMAIRQRWRDEGDDMLIVAYEDGQLAVIRHPLHGEPPTPERINQCWQRANNLDVLLFEPVAGRA